MMYRFFIFIVLFSACQRKAVPENNENNTAAFVEVDTTLSVSIIDELPENILKDIHHLLQLGYEKTNQRYNPALFRVYFNPELKDSILVQCPGNDTVYLTIGNKKNISTSLYSYLDLIGYRFYGPEDHWTHIPEIKLPFVIDTILFSFFKFRNLSPSYGVSRSSTPVLDSANYRFNRWKNRLRMGSLYNLSYGHYGTTFLRKYKEEIEANPEWRGKNKNGGYRAWKAGLKLCYTHPGVIELYKEDALERLQSAKKKSNPPYFINMEPPDGDGFCECENCPSISDQVYGLANEVAKYLFDIDTNVIVNLYGYNRHAEAPTFPLHKSILVGIVPYAFQSLGSPESMMQKWEGTGATLYLRDYLAIPIWSYDRATYPNSTFLNKINRLRENNYLGYTFETTASFMSVGLNFYLLSKSSWQQVKNERIYQTFLMDMFPGFEEEVSVVFENLPILDNNTYADAREKIRNLIVRSQKNHQIILRLKDLEFYIEYLYLLDKFLAQESEENLNLLLDKIMSTPGRKLLHPYGLYRVLKRKRNTDRLIESTPNHSPEIESTTNIQFSLRRRVQREYDPINPHFYLKTVNDLPTLPIRNSEGLIYVGGNYNGAVSFKAKLNKIYSSGTGTIVFRDMDDILVDEIHLTSDNKFHEYNLRLETDQFYKVNFLTPSSVIEFKGFNRPFAFTKPLFNRYLDKSVPFYFKIPRSINHALIKVPTKSNKVTLKSEGEPFFTQNQFESYNIAIDDMNGQIIEVNMHRHGLELLNIPHLLSIHPEGVIAQSNFE